MPHALCQSSEDHRTAWQYAVQHPVETAVLFIGGALTVATMWPLFLLAGASYLLYWSVKK